MIIIHNNTLKRIWGGGKWYKLLYFKVVLNHLKYERESVNILLNRIAAMPSPCFPVWTALLIIKFFIWGK